MARPRVVILGGGFGGIAAAKALRTAPVDVTVIDRSNHFVFQPLLYQVATASLAPSDISAPIRWVLRGQRNTTVLMADVVAIDTEQRIVRLGGGAPAVEYDYLIVATGARHAYFGRPEWEANAPGLKTIEDALEIRNRFLRAFEKAELATDAAERASYQTFVIIGGGPTGVELAGAMPLIARRAMRRDFRRIDTEHTRVLLLEGGDRVLPTFPEELSAAAKKALEGLGVEVRTGSIVTGVEPDAIHVGSERILTRTVFWAAGNAGSPAAASLGVPLDRAGRVPVAPDLSVPGQPNIFVVGDLAAVPWKDGLFVPGVAPAANQEGRHASRNIRRDLAGDERKPFRYVDKGNLATIGRNQAVADFGRIRVRGWAAWWLWLVIHIMYLVGFRNRASVLLQWAYAYFTYQRGVRLITGLGKRH